MDVLGTVGEYPYLLAVIVAVAVCAVLTAREVIEANRAIGANQGAVLFEQNLEAIAAGKTAQDLLIQEELTGLEKKIADAGLNMTPRTFTMLRVGIPAAALAVLGLAAGPIAGAVGALLGWVGFNSTIDRKTRRRTELMERQLCQAEMQIAENSRGGLSTERSIAVCIEQSDEPLRSQLARVHNEISYTDLTLADAFYNMAARTSSSDVHLLASVISVQQETGSNFADTMNFLAETIGKKMEMRRTLKSRISEMQLTKYVVAATPALVFVMCSFIMDGFTEFYTANPIGYVIMGIAVALVFIGLRILGRLESVEID